MKRLLVLATMGLLVALASVGHATELYLAVTPAADLPSAATLQAAIEQELGIALTPAPATQPLAADAAVLSIAPQQPGRATVSFRSPDGHVAGRALALPADPQRALETLALLAANLVRNEADELLEGWRATAPKPLPQPATPTEPPISPAEPIADVPLALDLLPGFGWPQWSPGPERRHLAVGLLATVSAELDGVALAPLFHVQTRRVQGLQIAASANVSIGPLQGAQLSGGVNLAFDSVAGTQVGLLNATQGTVRGAQVGLLNLATGRVTGLQVGLLNLADDADVGVGLLSIYRHGRTHVQVAAQEGGAFDAELEHGSRFLHQIVALGVRREAGQWHPQAGLGLGGQVRLGERLHVAVDALELLSTGVLAGEGSLLWLTQARLTVGVRVLGPVTAFAGASYEVTSAWRDRLPPGLPHEVEPPSMPRERALQVLRQGPHVVVGVRLF